MLLNGARVGAADHARCDGRVIDFEGGFVMSRFVGRRIASLVVASAVLAGGLTAGSGIAAASTEDNASSVEVIFSDPNPVHVAKAVIFYAINIPLWIVLGSTGIYDNGCRGICPGQ